MNIYLKWIFKFCFWIKKDLLVERFRILYLRNGTVKKFFIKRWKYSLIFIYFSFFLYICFIFLFVIFISFCRYLILLYINKNNKFFFLLFIYLLFLERKWVLGLVNLIDSCWVRFTMFFFFLLEILWVIFVVKVLFCIRSIFNFWKI